MNKFKIYQPTVYSDDGTNISYDLPRELEYNQAFLSVEDCEDWLEEHGYDIEDCHISEVDWDDDTEILFP